MKSKITIETNDCRCERCGHEWYTVNDPRVCPACHSVWWETPRVRGGSQKPAKKRPNLKTIIPQKPL